LGQELPTLPANIPSVQPPAAAAPPSPAAPTLTPGPGASSDSFLTDLSGKISTADALLALPPAEQANMLVFLKPSELAKVLRQTTDVELKMTVIDTLESVGSPSALDIIYHCLDDPDPQIQTRALSAADRLLGAE
jgi:hypothetical protein